MRTDPMTTPVLPLTAGPAWIEDAAGNRVTLRGAFSLGRSASNQVALQDDRVSRRHAVIQAQGEGEYWLVDFGSRNGTYLNGRRITSPSRLRHRDAIRLGSSDLIFHQPDAGGTGVVSATLAGQTVTEIRTVACWLLVADIIDSSRLVREVAPEELPLITGQWLSECKLTVEGHGGRINQFLGDGFFAFWRDRPGIEPDLEGALQTLQRLQQEGRPPFRLAVHQGSLTIGGTPLGEEERLSGQEVHFAFRMEKLAGSLGHTRLLSEPAWRRLSPLVPAREAGAHALHGFDGQFRFYAF